LDAELIERLFLANNHLAEIVDHLILRVAELEARLGMNISNSSVSSTTPGVVGKVTETRDTVDVEIKVVVTEYDKTEVQCPCCDEVTAADFPANVSATKQYGEGVDATVVLLNRYANVSMDQDKTSKLLANVLGVPISTGMVDNYKQDEHKKFVGLSGSDFK
jgi:hypothetical protein